MSRRRAQCGKRAAARGAREAAQGTHRDEHGVQNSLLRRSVHEGEREKVVYAERFQEQNNRAKVSALNLRDHRRQELAIVHALSVEAKAHPGAGAPRTPRALICVCPRDRRDLERVHSNLRIVDLDLGKTGVDDVPAFRYK